MEHELRYYLGEIKKAMTLPEDNEQGLKPFKPTYMVTAVKLPTGAIELATNTSNIIEKIDYILDVYDANMRLTTNTNIVMQNIMIV